MQILSDLVYFTHSTTYMGSGDPEVVLQYENMTHKVAKFAYTTTIRLSLHRCCKDHK